jgi:N-methylhydantoinase A
MGVLVKDLEMDFSRTRLVMEGSPDSAANVGDVYRALEDRARKAFSRQQPDGARLELTRMADVRYVGQNHELTVEVPAGSVDDAMLTTVKERFHDAHREMFGYASEEKRLELITFRVKARLPVDRHDFSGVNAGVRAGNAAPVASRKVYFDEAGGFVDCPIYERSVLRPGDALEGPAIVEQMDATTVIPPDFVARVDDTFNLMLQLKGA